MAACACSQAIGADRVGRCKEIGCTFDISEKQILKRFFKVRDSIRVLGLSQSFRHQIRLSPGLRQKGMAR
jgi:hypothetical protein